MRKIYVAALGATIAAVSGSTAYAQSLSFGDFDISLSPRVWFRTDNSAAVNRLGASAISPSTLVPGTFNTDIRSEGSLDFPMFGLSATISPHNFQMMGGATDFVITAFGGQGQSTLIHTQVFPVGGTFGAANAFEETDHADRIDVEALARTALNSYATVLYGLRFIRQDDDYTTFDLVHGVPTTFTTRSGNITHLPISESTPMAESGMQFSVPLSADGAQRLVAGATLGVGISLVSAPAIGSPSYLTGLLDTSVGYQYSFNNSLSALIRYRFEALAYFRGGSLLDDNLQVIHGPEIGFSAVF